MICEENNTRTNQLCYKQVYKTNTTQAAQTSTLWLFPNQQLQTPFNSLPSNRPLHSVLLGLSINQVFLEKPKMSKENTYF